ncbi:hypothetical protein NH340_JMT04565 [Sarcoptes scabiei]|nr:hypothetical protein NH340_JMT04565 [Sarcoptes scabiei]
MFRSIFLIICLIKLSYQNGITTNTIHDVMRSMPKNSQPIDLHIDNRTMVEIFNDTDSLLRRLGGGDSVLVQLNDTLSNQSALALIVRTANFGNDLLRQYQMFYVNLIEDQISSYRYYWKLMADFVRKNVNSVWNTMWSPVNRIQNYFRFAPQSSNKPSSLEHEFFIAMPYMLRSMNLPLEIEEQLFQLDSTKSNTTQPTLINNSIAENSTVYNSTESKAPNDQSLQQLVRRLVMKVLGAFNGYIKPSRADLVSKGIFITDQGIRITIIGEQMRSGRIESYSIENEHQSIHHH